MTYPTYRTNCCEIGDGKQRTTLHDNHAMNDQQLLRRLVGFDSVSRNSNLPIADFLCEYLDRPGVRIQRNPSPDGTKTNLVIAFGPDTDEHRNGLVLSGHMDVVPADEEGVS